MWYETTQQKKPKTFYTVKPLPCNCSYMGSTVYVTVSDFSKSAVTFVLLMIKKLDICRIKSRCSQYVNFAYSVWTRTKLNQNTFTPHIPILRSGMRGWGDRQIIAGLIMLWDQAHQSAYSFSLSIYLLSFLTTAVSASLIIQVLKSPRELRLLHVQNQPDQINCFKERKRANLSLNKD